MLASREGRRGNFKEALDMLQKARPLLASVQNYTVPLQFYETLGDVQLRSGEYESAEKALASAILIGETGALAIHGDHDRLVWDRQTGQAYRGMVKIRLHAAKAEEAL